MENTAISLMQEYYDRRAPVYDQSMQYDQPETVVRQKPVIDKLCHWMAGRTVLEIACGPGFWTTWVTQSAKSIVATDYNESTLVEARKKEINQDRVNFRVADAYALPDFGLLFDAAFGVDWFCHVPIKARTRFLDGLHKKLEPNADIVFCDQLPRAEEGSSPVNSEDHFQVRTLPDGSEHRVIKNYPSESEVRAIFMPYAQSIEYNSFPESRRWMVRYILRSVV